MESVSVEIDTANGTATTTRRKLTTKFLRGKTENEFQSRKSETEGKTISEISEKEYQSENKEETHEGKKRSFWGLVKISLLILLLFLIILFSLRKSRGK